MRPIILAFCLIASGAGADPAAHLAAGNAWRALDEFGAALSAYDAGLREAPGRADLLAERALTLHRLGETAAARAALAQALGAGPAEPAPLTARAGLALLAGDEASAARDVSAALQHAPQDRRALMLQGLLAARRAGPALPPRAMEELRQDFGPWLAE